MSREIDNTGKIIVCDRIIETSQRTNKTDMAPELSNLNGTIGFSVGQKQFSKDFSMSLSGNPNVSNSVPASLRVDIYRNGTKLDISNPIVKGSSLLWESMDGRFMKFGEYTETFMQEIGIGNLEKNKEKFKVTWTTKDADSVPLTATLDVSIGEKVQYALSRYIDPSKVAEDAIVWFDTMEGALGVSHPYSCYLWTRSSSYYDFVNNLYVDWKYFKGELYYEGQSVNDTVDDMADKLNKYIEFTSSTDRFTVNKRSNGNDTVRMGVNINGYSNISFQWESLTSLFQLLPTGQDGNQNVAFTIPHNNDYSSISIKVSVTYSDGGESESMVHQFDLSPLDVTKPELYLGVLESIPSGDYISSLSKKVMTGDWFLLKSTNELYTWNGSTWVCINGDSVTGTTFKDLEKVSVALVDMIKIGTNNKTTATILGVFKMLCADNGFIKFLKTWALFCGAGDETSGFYCRIADHDPTTGESLAKPVFIVKYNGNTVFQIDPSSGNVFFGKPNSGLSAPESGFMYKASDSSIVSKDNKVVINSNGEIIATNGSFSGNINATSGSFKGTLESASGTFTGSFVTSAIESRPPKETAVSASVTLDSVAENQYSKLETLSIGKNTVYNATHSADPNVRYIEKYMSDGFNTLRRFTLRDKNLVLLYKCKYEANIQGTNYSTTIPAGTLSLGVTGDVLVFNVDKIPYSSTDLEVGQIYQNSNHQLFIKT